MKYRICAHLLPNHRLKAIASSSDKFCRWAAWFLLLLQSKSYGLAGLLEPLCLSMGRRISFGGRSRVSYRFFRLRSDILCSPSTDKTFCVLPIPGTLQNLLFFRPCLLLLSFLPIEMFECSFWPDINWSTSFQIALGFSKFFNCRSLLK